MDGRQGRAVILTALGLEYDAVRTWLAKPEHVVHPSGTRYEIGKLADPAPAWEVTLAEIGEGNQAAAALTGQAIDAFNPNLVLFVGVAGSLVESVDLGDVVAATRVDAYHGGKVVARRFLDRPVTWPAAWRLDQAARQVRREGRWINRLAELPSPPPKVHLKPILAGEVVLDSRESRLYRFLREHYNDAVAVEMEGAGLAVAAHASGDVPAMVIRGISDLAGGAKTATDAVGWQPRAAQRATAFAVELLAALDPNTVSRRGLAESQGTPPGSKDVVAKSTSASSQHRTRTPETLPMQQFPTGLANPTKHDIELFDRFQSKLNPERGIIETLRSLIMPEAIGEGLELDGSDATAIIDILHDFDRSPFINEQVEQCRLRLIEEARKFATAWLTTYPRESYDYTWPNITVKVTQNDRLFELCKGIVEAHALLFLTALRNGLTGGEPLKKPGLYE